MRNRLILTAAAAALSGLLLAGCGDGSPGSPSGSTTTPPTGTGVLETAPPPTADPGDDGIEHEVTYPFGTPTTAVTHDAGANDRVYLVGVYVGDHPEGDPAFQRMSFYFRGGFPSYRFGYVPQITADASGDPVPLEGAYFLNVVFTDAQAHDDNTGESTVDQTPARPVHLKALLDYAAAGDFEGHVTYGIGVAELGDSAPAIRVGELMRADGAGDFFYVVYVDVRSG